MPLGFNLAGLVARLSSLQAYAAKRLYSALQENRTQVHAAVAIAHWVGWAILLTGLLMGGGNVAGAGIRGGVGDW